MKKLLYLIILTLAPHFSRAQQSLKPEWNATISVVNEAGQPIAGADVEASYYVTPPPGRTEASESLRGLTDTNGIVRLTQTNTGSVGLGFQASKAGYYSTRAGHQFDRFQDGDMEKWNPHITLALKDIGKPIAMSAKRVENGPPVFKEPVGYDLTAGDWVAPYGKGVNSDFLFTENHADAKSGYTLTVSFPHSGDGIQGFTRDWRLGVSGLLSSHEAPIGGYQPKYEQTQMADPNRIYYFRVRTVLDSQGNILSTHYGKIYGDFMQFAYYLNPTPDDRNVEFDPKQNLLKGLKSFERVDAP